MLNEKLYIKCKINNEANHESDAITSLLITYVLFPYTKFIEEALK